jgi:F-type H+-transporting ATPase subunit c
LNESISYLKVRSIQTTAVSRDIDSAAKYIGAGAATVGVAGAGNYFIIKLTKIL